MEDNKDRDEVLAAVEEDGDALQYASKELQNDPELKKLAEGHMQFNWHYPDG